MNDYEPTMGMNFIKNPADLTDWSINRAGRPGDSVQTLNFLMSTTSPRPSPPFIQMAERVPRAGGARGYSAAGKPAHLGSLG